MKIQNILLPFDGSTHSINAANYALNFAEQYSAHVTIVNCYEWSSSVVEVPAPLLVDIESISKKRSQDVLNTAKEIFKDRAVDFDIKTLYGSPGRVLSQLAASKKFDMIIMGSHGHSDIAGLFLGSVTHKVLNTIYCPVLVVP